MPFDPEDHRLTAYALGELDEAERAEIQKMIADDPDADRWLAETRSMADLLTAELKAEPTPETKPSPMVMPAPRPRPRGRRWILACGGLAAGVLALVLTLKPNVEFTLAKTRSTAEPSSAVSRILATRPAPAAPDMIARSPGAEGSAPLSEPEATLLARAGDRKPVPAEPSAPSGMMGPGMGMGMGMGGSVASPPGYVPPPSPATPAQDSTKRVRGGERRFGEMEQALAQAQQSANEFSSQNDALRAKISRENLAMMPAESARPAASGSNSAQGPQQGNQKLSQGQSGLQQGQQGNQQLAQQGQSGQQDYQPQGQGQSGQRGLETVLREEKVADRNSVGDQAPTVEARFRKQIRRDPMKAGLKAEFGVPILGKEVMIRRVPTPELRDAEEKPADRPQGDAFATIIENPFVTTSESAVSTFSIDVDTAAYANVRRYLNQNVRPPADAVRIEELLNYFTYHDPAPKGEEPFSANVEIARIPWSADHRLARIALKGRAVAADNRPASNLVFLIDVSGSMQDMDKLPLLKAGMKMLVDSLGENDRVAIVVYASAEGLALPSTRCDHKAEILSTLDQLQAGGSTAGGKGIELAYDLAVRHFIPGGTNRVILATDGDFNVGISSKDDLDRLIEEKRKTGVSLSVLGFGQGNVKHDRMESMADKGNGQYSYIDTLKEARKVLVEQIGGTLVTIAKDVKIQVEFNPDEVAAYRLIGYENRMLAAKDFADDTKDAGEIGAGLSVTALYEIVPRENRPAANDGWMMDFRLRFKAPDGDVSRLVERKVGDDRKDFAAASDDFKFASAVAGFGMMLRNSAHKGTLTWPIVEELAAGAASRDDSGYRSEFLGLVRKAATMMAR